MITRDDGTILVSATVPYVADRPDEDYLALLAPRIPPSHRPDPATLDLSAIMDGGSGTPAEVVATVTAFPLTREPEPDGGPEMRLVVAAGGAAVAIQCRRRGCKTPTSRGDRWHEQLLPPDATPRDVEQLWMSHRLAHANREK